MQPTKEIHFSIAEQEWIEKLQEMFGVNYLDAVQYVVDYKREQAFMYKQQGHTKMFIQLMDELGELTDEMKEAEAPASNKHFRQIIIPGEDDNNNDDCDTKPEFYLK